MYDLAPLKEGSVWMVTFSSIQPLYGESEMIRVNLMTGETQKAA
jgi:hypothetical protein